VPGARTGAGPVDFRALIAGKREIVDGLRTAKYVNLAERHGFELLEGSARFLEGPALEAGGSRIEAARFLIATGAEPRLPAIRGLAASGFLTSTTAI
jgi:mercuric reductase